MRYTIILIFVALPFMFFAQEQTNPPSKQYEDSLFLTNVMGYEVKTTKFYAKNHPWKKEILASLRDELFDIQGVYAIKIVDEGRVLKVDHSAHVTFDDIKAYIVNYTIDFEVYRTIPYEE